MDVWIFANGKIIAKDLLKKQINEKSLIIAADGGAHLIRGMDLIANVVIGDLDSFPEADREWAEKNGVEFVTYPVKKDETDLQLAIDYALEKEPDVIRIAGAIGGRIDQTLGNIFLLAQSKLESIDIKLEDGLEEIFLIKNISKIYGIEGEIVSLIPLGGEVHGVFTTGLQYPLDGETLFPDQTRGISNRMTNKLATVKVGNGIIICVHTREKIDWS